MNPITKHPEFYVQNLRLVSTPYDQSKVREFVENFDKRALSRNLPNILDLFKELDEFEELIPPRPNQKPLRCPPPYNPRLARPNQFGPFGVAPGPGQGQSSQFQPTVMPTPVTLPMAQQKQQQHQMPVDLNRPPQTPSSMNAMPQTPGSSSSNARSPKMRHMSTTSDTYGELETLQSLSHSFQSDMGSSQTNQNTPMGGLGSSSADSDSSSCAVTPVVESRATPIGGQSSATGVAGTSALNDFPYHGERKSSLQDTIDSVVLATVSSANPQPSINSPVMTSASSYDFSPRRRPSEASSVFDLRQTPSDDLMITSPTPHSAPVCPVSGQPASMLMGAAGGDNMPSSGQHLPPSSQLQRTQRAASICLPSQPQPQLQQASSLDVFEFDQAAEQQQQQQLYDPTGGGPTATTSHHRWSTPNIGVMGGYGGEPDFQAATMGYNPDGSMSGYMPYHDASQNPQYHQQLMRNSGDQSVMGMGGNIAAMRGAPGNGIRRRRSRRNAANVGDRTYEQALKEMKKAEKAALRGAKAPRRPRRPRGSSTIQSLAPGTSHADAAAKMRAKFFGNSGEMMGEHQNFSDETSSSFSSDANFSIGNPNSALSMEVQQQQIRCQQQQQHQQLNSSANKPRKDSFSNSGQMNQTTAFGNVPGTPTKEKDFSTMSAQLQRHHSFDAAAFENSMCIGSSQQQQQQFYRSESQQPQQQHQMLQQRQFSLQADSISVEQKRRADSAAAASRVAPMDVEPSDVFEDESDENDDDEEMMTQGLTAQQASNLFENLSKTIPPNHSNKDSPSSLQQQANNASILSSTKRKGSILDDVIGKLTNRCQTSTGGFIDESSSSSMPAEADIEPSIKKTKFDVQDDGSIGKDCPQKPATSNLQPSQQSATSFGNPGTSTTPQQKILAKQLSAASSGAGGDQSCSSSSTTSSEHSPATTSTTGLKLVIRKRDLKLIDQQQQQQQQQQMTSNSTVGQSAMDAPITQQSFATTREPNPQNMSSTSRNAQPLKTTSVAKPNSTNAPDFAASKNIQNLQHQNQQQLLKRASPSLLAAAENHVKQALAGGLTVQQMVQQRQQQDPNSAASLKFNDYKQKVQEKKLKKVVNVQTGASSSTAAVPASSAASAVAAAAANISNLNQSAAALLGFSALKAAALQQNLTPAESAKLTAKLLEKVQNAAVKTTKTDNERKNTGGNPLQQQTNVNAASSSSTNATSSGSTTDQSSVFPGAEGIIFSKTLTGYKIPRIEEKSNAGGSSPAAVAAGSSPHRKAPPFQPPSQQSSHGAVQQTSSSSQQLQQQQQGMQKKPKSILKNARTTTSAAPSSAALTFGVAEREPPSSAVSQFTAQQHFNPPAATQRPDASHNAAAAAAAAAVAAALNQQKRQPLLPDPSPAFFAAAAAAAAGGGVDSTSVAAAQQQAAMAAQMMSTFGAFLPMGTSARAAVAAAAAAAASSTRSTPQRINEEEDFVLTTEAPASPDDM